MAMKRTRTPWMKAGDFGRSLARGIGVNLLVSDMAAMEAFCRDVLGADIIYADEDFAAIELLGSVFMLHADHSYLDNAMTGTIAGAETRGAGVELRLYGANPDAVEAAARDHGHIVLAGAIDKPHGLRESYVVGPDGYIFVPSAPLAG
ncbi:MULTISPECIES: hypothetical protein [unclassified Mesorhizobium]|uniref:VOC family protein n=1 Tax=unclassified Mesorhizobium TaxID=325217 RepID=UPI00112DE49A|nr:MULTISPECIES: hypothetical protein [unclassified Mesorhizobium]MCA0056461.1 hypothetical protein [Mesorhizobium sp. B261B1A]TPI55496.1 hypothetical protein FJW11_08605 [Mesorhizobium sp. B3-1-1]TPJ68679.1 hypothetical protein FJ462_13360 [Mesorhizobium sp. B2-6-7]TPJ87790.1 hypothetical protein FJ422_08175 [Mesorhizobium sp. B2-6-3]TPJ93107.1 hypothetical protein FJ491_27900 [Mesorhizobium sp. B2-5-10]